MHKLSWSWKWEKITFQKFCNKSLTSSIRQKEKFRLQLSILFCVVSTTWDFEPLAFPLPRVEGVFPLPPRVPVPLARPRDLPLVIDVRFCPSSLSSKSLNPSSETVVRSRVSARIYYIHCNEKNLTNACSLMMLKTQSIKLQIKLDIVTSQHLPAQSLEQGVKYVQSKQ